MTFCQFAADFFYSVGLGLGKTDSPEVRFRKSISNERTFSATEDEVLLYKRLGIFHVYYFYLLGIFLNFKFSMFSSKGLLSWNLENLLS